MRLHQTISNGLYTNLVCSYSAVGTSDLVLYWRHDPAEEPTGVCPRLMRALLYRHTRPDYELVVVVVVVRAIEVCHSHLAKLKFDEILDLTADGFFL